MGVLILVCPNLGQSHFDPAQLLNNVVDKINNANNLKIDFIVKYLLLIVNIQRISNKIIWLIQSTYYFARSIGV